MRRGSILVICMSHKWKQLSDAMNVERTVWDGQHRGACRAF